MQTASIQFDPAPDEQSQGLEKCGIQPPGSVRKSRPQQLIDDRKATKKQIACLKRFGYKTDEPIRKADAWRMIAKSVDHRRSLAPTRCQEAFLRKRGKWTAGMLRGEAFDLIGAIMQDEKWKHV